MRRISLSMFVAFAFFVATAVAQSGTAPGGGQGTTGSSPSMGQPGGQQPGGQQPGMTQPDNSAPMGQTGQTDQNNSGMGHSDKDKGEKKLKGCVQSQGGQYVLESKHGKAIALTGQDVSAHVGHEVAVKGAWESGSSTATASSGNAGSSEKTFNVSSVDMISDTCKGSSKGTSGNMGSGTGTAPNGNNPNGTGTGAPPQ
jgi:hypothetical protein